MDREQAWRAECEAVLAQAAALADRLARFEAVDRERLAAVDSAIAALRRELASDSAISAALASRPGSIDPQWTGLLPWPVSPPDTGRPAAGPGPLSRRIRD